MAPTSEFAPADVKIMIVDGNAEQSKIVREMLEMQGFKTIEVATASARAIEELRYYRADVLIVDRTLLDMAGLDFVRRIRTLGSSPCPEVAIVYLDAPSQDGLAEAVKAGIDHFLAKPASIQAMIKRIRGLMLNPLPRMRTRDYLGPDRRRMPGDAYTGPERRTVDLMNRPAAE